MLLTLRLAGGRITAAAAGLLAATFGASPFLESFTLSGELLGSLPAALSLLAFCAYLRSRRARWLVLAGVLTGCALLVKQSALDGGLAAVAYLLWRERRGGLGASVLLTGSALAPVALAAAAATRFGDWWHAVVGYRFEGDSVLTGSLAGRGHELLLSAPALAKGLALLALLAALGWRRAPLLARLWLGASVVGVLGGGNFHPHYYVQLVPPLSLLGALGLRELWHRRSRSGFVLVAASTAATLVLALPVAWASPTGQAKAIWPHDAHLRHDAALSRYVRAHTRPRDRILALWADADLYYLADRPPATGYLWYRNIEAIPGALDEVRLALALRRPSLVLLVQRPGQLDTSGDTARILRRTYRLVAEVDGVPVYRPRSMAPGDRRS